MNEPKDPKMSGRIAMIALLIMAALVVFLVLGSG